MIKLGSKIRDNITGLEGVATARATYLYGCVRIELTPDKLDNGKIMDSYFLDEQRCEVLKEKKPKVSKDSSAKTGGPQKDAIRNNNF